MTVMAAFGTSAPCASSTVPERVAFVDWPSDETLSPAATKAIAIAFARFCLIEGTSKPGLIFLHLTDCFDRLLKLSQTLLSSLAHTHWPGLTIDMSSHSLKLVTCPQFSTGRMVGWSDH